MGMEEKVGMEGYKRRVPTYAESTTVPAEREVYDILGRLTHSDEAYADMVNFVRSLEESHPDIHEYSLAQILSGSTPNPSITTKVDMAGQDSMLTFMRELDEKYSPT